MRLPPVPISELIEMLVELDRAGAGPGVALHLREGHTLHGVVVGSKRAYALHTVVLAGLDAHGRRSDDLTYFDLAAIVAVTVRHTSQETTARALGRGVVDPLEGKEAPGRIVVARRLAELGAKLQAALAAPFAIEITPEAMAEPRRLLGLSELVDHVEALFLKYLTEPDAKAALVEKVQRLVLAYGKPKSVALEAPTKSLTITITLDGTVQERFTLAELERETGRVL